MTNSTDLRTKFADYVEAPPALTFDSADLIRSGHSGVRRRRALVAGVAAATVLVSLTGALALRAGGDPNSSGPTTTNEERGLPVFSTPSEEMPRMLDAVARDLLPGYERTKLEGFTWARSDQYYDGSEYPPEDVVSESRYDEATDWRTTYTKDGVEVTVSVAHDAPDSNGVDTSKCLIEPCRVDRLPGGITVQTQLYDATRANSVFVWFDSQPFFVVHAEANSWTFSKETLRRIVLDERLRFRLPEKTPELPSYMECLSAASDGRDVPGCPEKPHGKQR